MRGVRIPFKLKQVYYVPSSPVNLFSKISAQNSGMTFDEGDDQQYWYISGYAINGDKIVCARRLKDSRQYPHQRSTRNQNSNKYLLSNIRR